ALSSKPSVLPEPKQGKGQMTVTSNSSATIIPINSATKPTTVTPARVSFEAVREHLQRQIAADGKLKGKTGLIGVAISWFMDRREKGGRAIVDEQTLAALTATTDRTVRRAVEQLEDRHYRVERSKKPDGTQATNQYFPILHSGTVSWPGVTRDTRQDNQPKDTGVLRQDHQPEDMCDQAGGHPVHYRRTPVSSLPPRPPSRPPSVESAAPDGAALHTNHDEPKNKRVADEG